MSNPTATDDPAIALRPQAVTAVRQAQAERPDNFKIWATKLLRDATGCYLGDGARAVEWAIDHVAAMRLDGHRVPTTSGWRYEFPNGQTASVVNELTMCGCIGHTVCGYHTQVIADLIERLDEAEADGDTLAAAGSAAISPSGATDMTRVTDNNGRGARAAGSKRKPGGLAAQLLAAVELFGVDDTRAALREIRDRDAAKEN
ncbi:hypothetical protein [Micromonospora sp. NPDC005174]|uniref:hypothetical protein n=1 Tax=Micromonospora sp. NPDC005174 TaxID=3157018 RepID=UPI0033B327E4